MTKQIKTLDVLYAAHNATQINSTIDILLDPNATVRYTDNPRPRAVLVMPTHPTKDIRCNPLSANELMRAYA